MVARRAMKHSRLRRTLAVLGRTPLHPQWFVLRPDEGLERLLSQCGGTVLDVGCGEQKHVAALPEDCDYVGLDYPTTSAWYQGTPGLYGDAQALPIAEEAVDCVLLLDVLEHLPEPARCVREVYRVLKKGGRAITQVPFLYPIHDGPFDFRRWTSHGLRQLAQTNQFTVTEETFLGRPLETAGLLTNIALSTCALRWLERRHPAAVLSLLLPPVVLIVNCFSWLSARLAGSDPMMPFGYRAVWQK